MSYTDDLKPLNRSELNGLMPQMPFNHLLGLRVSRVHADGLTMEMEVRAELKNLLAGSIGAYVMHQPDLMVPGAPQKFDDRGALIDPETEQRLGDYLAALVTWTQRVLAIDAIKALGGDGV